MRLHCILDIGLLEKKVKEMMNNREKSLGAANSFNKSLHVFNII